MTGPKTLAEHVAPTLRRRPPTRAARRARSGWSAALPVSVTDDVDGARKQAAEQFAMYGHLPSYRAMLDREGYAGPRGRGDHRRRGRR